MVKIRLKRLGTKGRPFYRIVVARSTSGRNGAAVENLGTYNPLTQPHTVQIAEERALHWLMEGAQPTETTAYLLNQVGVLPKFLEQRPNLRKQYDFLDKRTEAISVKSALDAPAAEVIADAPKAEEAEPAHTAEAAEASPEVAPVAAETAEPAAEEPVAEEKPE